MWQKLDEMNKMNQDLMESIQRKKALRKKIKRMKAKKEKEEMQELTEWASFQAKLLLDDIDLHEKQQYNQIQQQQVPYYADQHVSFKRTPTNESAHEHGLKSILKSKSLSENTQNDPLQLELNLNDEQKIDFIDSPQISKKITLDSLMSVNMQPRESLVDNLFHKKSKSKNSTDDNESIASSDSESSDAEEEARIKEREDLRKRIEQMSHSHNITGKRRFRSAVFAVFAIRFLQQMVAENRPKMAIEFNRNLEQTLDAYAKLTGNLLKIYSLSVFRSIMRRNLLLVANNAKKGGWKSMFKLKSRQLISSDQDSLLFIRVHTMKLIECLQEYMQNAPNVLIDWFKQYLLMDRPALHKYALVNEHQLLDWDKYSFVLNYTPKQKKMMLLNFIAVRCMFKGVLFGNKDNEKKNMDNLCCIASIFYYIIRKFNTQLLELDKMIKIDFEMRDVCDNLLEDDHPIYDKLDTLVEDGVAKIDKYLEAFMLRVYKDETDDTTISTGTGSS